MRCKYTSPYIQPWLCRVVRGGDVALRQMFDDDVEACWDVPNPYLGFRSVEKRRVAVMDVFNTTVKLYVKKVSSVIF